MERVPLAGIGLPPTTSGDLRQMAACLRQVSEVTEDGGEAGVTIFWGGGHFSKGSLC